MDCSKISSLLAVGLIAAPLSATIQVTDNFALEGFVDMSYYSDDAAGSDDSIGLDQVEIDFLFSFDSVSAQADLNYFGDADGDVQLEQAFLTYSLESGISVTAGKYLSYLGWEGAEPVDLYQYSYAYGVGGYIPGYHNGVRVDYANESMEFGVSIVDDLAIGPITHTIADDDYGMELYAKFMPAEGLTLFAGYGHDENPDDADDTTDETADVFNFWASYEMGDLLLAVEYNNFDLYGVDGNSGLLMAYYSITEKVGLTGRIAMEDFDDDTLDNMSYTLSPSYAVSDNLLLLAEISLFEFDDETASESYTAFAVEALFMF